MMQVLISTFKANAASSYLRLISGSTGTWFNSYKQWLGHRYSLAITGTCAGKITHNVRQ